MIDDLLKNQSKLFWVLHLGAWLAWGLIAKYAYTAATLEDVPPSYFIYVMVISAVGALITLFLRYFYRWSFTKPLWLQALAFMAGTVAGG